MNIIEKKNSVIINNANDFNIIHIFECGQCFRWDRYAINSYIGVVKDKVLLVEQEDNKIEFYNTNINDFNNIWKEYFDLERDYSSIKNILSKDKTLDEAVRFGCGIRILYQDIWECLISFIISANNRIPLIKKAVNNISKKYGYRLSFDNREYFSFPLPEQLRDATIEDLEKCGVGFRAKYIKNVVQGVLNGDIELDKVKLLQTELAREELVKIQGVGNKIADCVLLFAAKKYDAFPVDVWVKRVMEYFYSDRPLKLQEIQHVAKYLFGDLAGFAQQYLFYYARELKIGK